MFPLIPGVKLSFHSSVEVTVSGHAHREARLEQAAGLQGIADLLKGRTRKTHLLQVLNFAGTTEQPA